MNTEQERIDFEAWWESTPILKENKRTIAEKAYQAGRAALQSQPTNRWYAIDNVGLATLCADKQDAIKTASEAAQLYPKRAPYVVARMVPADNALQSQDREDDPLQPAVNWLLKASPDSFPNATELQAQLMIGYNRAKRLFDHARRIEGE